MSTTSKNPNNKSVGGTLHCAIHSLQLLIIAASLLLVCSVWVLRLCHRRPTFSDPLKVTSVPLIRIGTMYECSLIRWWIFIVYAPGYYAVIDGGSEKLCRLLKKKYGEVEHFKITRAVIWNLQGIQVNVIWRLSSKQICLHLPHFSALIPISRTATCILNSSR